MDMFTVKRRSYVMDLLDQRFKDKKLDVEKIDIERSLGRVVSRPVTAYENIPSFRRSTVDGYALQASDTVGCSEALPAFLTKIGETKMGEGTQLSLSGLEAVYVPTGGIVPEGADSVVMIEYTEMFDDEVAVNRPVHPRENIVGIGDDVSENEEVISAHTLLRTQHVGAMAALGIASVDVFRRVKVAIISTGDELVDIGSELKIGEIRDINSYSLRSMLTAIGCEVAYQKRIKDDFDQIHSALKEAVETCDVVLVSGGSSVGNHDMTPEIINALGDPGVLVHGVAIKPGKPTIVAQVGDTAVFGLPGHPTSCIVSYKTIVEPFIHKTLMGINEPSRTILAKSGFQAHVSSGRDVFYMVCLEEDGDDYLVHPVHGKSGMISLLSKSDGYIEIPMEKEGLEKGEFVKVHLFR